MDLRGPDLVWRQQTKKTSKIAWKLAKYFSEAENWRVLDLDPDNFWEAYV